MQHYQLTYSSLGVASISLGSSGMGPKIVSGSNASNIGYATSFGNLQITVGEGAILRPTSQIEGGLLSGALDSYSITEDLINDTDNLAFIMSSEVNAQHSRGNDLNGRPGQEMFSTFGLTAELSPSASADLQVQVDVTKPLNLPSGTMTAQYDKVQELWTLSGDGLASPISGKDQIKGEGFTINIDWHSTEWRLF